MRKMISVVTGAVYYLPLGVPATMTANSLTVCTAAVLRAVRKNNRKTVGFIMLHRGAHNCQYFQGQINKAIYDAKINKDEVEWIIEGVQTASDTSLEDVKTSDAWAGGQPTTSDSSDSALESDIRETLNPINMNDFNKIKTVGSREGFMVKKMKVDIEDNGNIVIEKPGGISTTNKVLMAGGTLIVGGLLFMAFNHFKSK
jgi:hypothetical protein